MQGEKKKRELKEWGRGKDFDGKESGETQAVEEFRNVGKGTAGRVGCLKLRGEYMYVAEGKGGFRVYDVASIANKGFSEPIVSGPFSKLGHDAGIRTKNEIGRASCRERVCQYV